MHQFEVRGVWGVAWIWILGCTAPLSPGSDSAQRQERTKAQPELEEGENVVARINGHPITLAEVEALSRESKLPPREALRELEKEVLLFDAAQRAMVDVDAKIEREWRRALVRAFLKKEIEERYRPENVTEEAIEERAQEIRRALVVPEKRIAFHLLVVVPPNADAGRWDKAKRLATEILGSIQASSDPIAALKAQKGGQRDGFEIRVEQVGPLAQEELEPNFAKALFGVNQPGLLNEVVRTRYGLHVVALLEILPGWEVPREEWEPVIRRQLANEERAKTLEALADRLRQHFEVWFSPKLEDQLSALEGPVARPKAAP
ncbi:MAG: peptidylprolyl isomerase [Deltaproteobacteria bacterium]|nr:peptidylprolyl isomerase [Deltaproteobacteria bacterium]